MRRNLKKRLSHSFLGSPSRIVDGDSSGEKFDRTVTYIRVTFKMGVIACFFFFKFSHACFCYQVIVKNVGVIQIEKLALLIGKMHESSLRLKVLSGTLSPILVLLTPELHNSMTPELHNCNRIVC